MGYCTNCGAQMVGDGGFCSRCGNQAPTAVPASQSSRNVSDLYVDPPPPMSPHTVYAPRPAAPRANAHGLLLGIAGGVVLLLSLIVGYLFLTRTTSEVEVPTPEKALTKAGEPVSDEVVKYVTSGVNIRSRATAVGASEVTGRLDRGSAVRGIMRRGLSGDSWWLELSDGRGYVSAVNLSDAPPVAAPPVQRALIVGAETCSVATKSGNLRVRTTPNGRIIGGMPLGSRVQVVERSQDLYGQVWVRVRPVDPRYPVGWAAAEFLAC